MSSVDELAKLPRRRMSEDDRTVSSFSAKAMVTLFRNASVTMAQQMAALRNNSGKLPGDVSSQVAELERRLETLTAELDSMQTSLIEERDRIIAYSTAEVALLKQCDVEKTKQIATLHQDYAKLQKNSSSQVAVLQKRCNAQSKQLDSLILERDREKSANAAKAEQITKLQQQLTASGSELTKLRADWKAQSEELVSVQSKLEKETSAVVKPKVALESLLELSSPSTEPWEYEVQSHVQYGVICALPIDTTDGDHIRRKHQWERDPTGDCYVPGYFESKLRMASFLRQLSCEILTI